MNAPDLYIPFMAACTYCVLASVALTAGKRFKPDTMYATARPRARWPMLRLCAATRDDYNALCNLRHGL